MNHPSLSLQWLVRIALIAVLITAASANDILKTTGFTTCMVDPNIAVTTLNIQYDRSTQQVHFDVAGTSSKVENVTAALYVTAYGKQVYQKSFDPCDQNSKVDELCPGESKIYRGIPGANTIASSGRLILSQGFAKCSIVVRRSNTLYCLQRSRS